MVLIFAITGTPFIPYWCSVKTCSLQRHPYLGGEDPLQATYILHLYCKTVKVHQLVYIFDADTATTIFRCITFQMVVSA